MTQRLVSVLAFVLLIVGCSKDRSAYIPENAPGPKKASELGLITNASQEQLDQIIKSHPKVQVRTLNKELELFEFINIDRADLESITHKVSVENRFVPFENQDLSRNSSFQATSQDAISALRTCRRPTRAVNLQIASDLTFVQGQPPRLEFGNTLQLAAATSTDGSVEDGVRIVWDIQGPTLSNIRIEQGIQNQQSITPDMPGIYLISVIAQDRRLECTVRNLQLEVTFNAPLLSVEEVGSINGALNRAEVSHFKDTNALAAQQITQGQGVVVAVLDSGLDYNHPDIRQNLQIKTAEIDSNTDKDNNGLPGDFLGWDFAQGDNMPFDDVGHGSHVAGLVASKALGMAPQAKILPVKIGGNFGVDTGSALRGLSYAISEGVDIVNMSFGGMHITPNLPANIPPAAAQQILSQIQQAQDQEKQLYTQLFELAEQNDILIITASGNGDRAGRALDIGRTISSPASFEADNHLVVTATARNQHTTYGNYSRRLVHIGAPGGDPVEPVLSLASLNARGAAYVPNVGTSMAAPVTAGAAALVRSQHPHLTAAEVKNLLMRTGKPLPSLQRITVSGNQLDVLKALQSVAPQVATN